MHPRPGDLEIVYLGIADAAQNITASNEEAYKTLLRGYIDFHNDFFYFPERLESGVTADMSNLCGNSANMFSFNLGNLVRQKGRSNVVTTSYLHYVVYFSCM